MKIAIGMDVHAKKTSAYAVYAGIGEVSDRHADLLNSFNKEFGSFPSTGDGMKRMAAFMSRHECYALMENSTKTHEIYWILKGLGISAIVAQANDLYRITKSVKKTDRNDSIELAGYMRRKLNGEREFSECFIPSTEWMTKREMCRGLSNENRYLKDTKLRIRAHLLLHGIHLSKEYSDITSGKALRELERFKDPYLMMQIRFARDAHERIKMMEKTVRYMFSGNRMYELLYSIPGIGVLTAAYLTSLIVDIRRFQSSSQFTASFGVVPKMRDSAESSPNCSTTHRGDELARDLLKQCVSSHKNCVEDSVVTKMYHRLVKNGKAKTEALIAAVRKFLTVIWSVLKNDEPYTCDPDILRMTREAEEQEEG